MNRPPLVTYIRDRKRNPIGALVATSPTNIGWSLCHPKDRNSFDKRIAVHAATERSLRGTRKQTPHDVEKMLPRFRARAATYFER